MEMWEILVPANDNDGVVIATEQHHVWDDMVRELSGGLTVLDPVKGQWIDHENQLFKEPMIPVRVLADREIINQIIDLALDFYDQKAVLAYKISSEVILRSRQG